jgi:hypothetical protein
MNVSQCGANVEDQVKRLGEEETVELIRRYLVSTRQIRDERCPLVCGIDIQDVAARYA